MKWKLKSDKSKKNKSRTSVVLKENKRKRLYINMFVVWPYLLILHIHACEHYAMAL